MVRLRLGGLIVPNATHTYGAKWVMKMDECIHILKKFKKLNPWKGSIAERKQKFRWCFEQLCKLYDVKCRLVFAVPDDITQWYSSGGSYYDGLNNEIVLRGRLSVITFLHEFAHKLGMGQREAKQWSEKLFKLVWPEKYAKLVRVGGLLVRR